MLIMRISALLSLFTLSIMCTEAIAEVSYSDFAAMNEQIKTLRGDIEQLQYELDVLKDSIQKMNKDVEFRVTELNNQYAKMLDDKKTINSIDKYVDAAKPTTKEQKQTADIAQPGNTQSKATATMQMQNSNSNTNSSAKKASTNTSMSAEDEYQAAYDAIKTKNYKSAIELFQNFIKKYKNHKLVSSAHYWVGEAYSAENNYEMALVEYLKGYQKNPKGPKAPDNLIKIGINLSKVEKRKQACAIFVKFKQEFPAASEASKKRVETEMKRLRCEDQSTS